MVDEVADGAVAEDSFEFSGFFFVLHDRLGIEGFFGEEGAFGIGDSFDLVAIVMKHLCDVVACVPESLNCYGDFLWRPGVCFFVFFEDVVGAESSGFFSALGAALGDWFSGDGCRDLLSCDGVDFICHPGHDESVGVDVWGRDVFVWADEVIDGSDVSSRKAL